MGDDPVYDGPHRYHDPEYVRSWAAEANSKRRHRKAVFRAFVAELLPLERITVLDLGSGPGFLAEEILDDCDVAAYTLFDFSEQMIELARVRLARFGNTTRFIHGSFAAPGWHHDLPGDYDAIVCLQAVHELRDPALVPQLYADAKSLLSAKGVLIVGDLTSDDGESKPHFLTAERQHHAMTEAGFSESKTVLEVEDLVVIVARR
jgi:SAM-dependent methyltransferase